MNSVNLIGNLTKDPALVERQGSKVCDLRLAVNGVGKAPPLYIDVASFGAQADACAAHLTTGSQVAVSGSLRYAEWESEGTKRSKHSLIAREVRFLDKRPISAEQSDSGE